MEANNFRQLKIAKPFVWLSHWAGVFLISVGVLGSSIPMDDAVQGSLIFFFIGVFLQFATVISRKRILISEEFIQLEEKTIFMKDHVRKIFYRDIKSVVESDFHTTLIIHLENEAISLPNLVELPFDGMKFPQNKLVIKDYIEKRLKS